MHPQRSSEGDLGDGQPAGGGSGSKRAPRYSRAHSVAMVGSWSETSPPRTFPYASHRFARSGFGILSGGDRTRARSGLLLRRLCGRDPGKLTRRSGLVLVFFLAFQCIKGTSARSSTTPRRIWCSGARRRPPSAPAQGAPQLFGDVGVRAVIWTRAWTESSIAVEWKLAPGWPMARVTAATRLCRLPSAGEGVATLRGGFQVGETTPN